MRATRIPFLLLLLSAVVMTGCRLTIEVPANGSVRSKSGDYRCKARSSCTIRVSNTRFDETFVAVPAAGYAFNGWKKRERGLCGGEYLDCSLSTAGLADIPLLLSILDSNTEFYLEPEFKKIGNNKVTRGPVAGATVKAYTFDNLDKPVETKKTLDARKDLDAAGTFSLSLNGVGDDELVAVVAIGGEDLDVDGDGKLDKKTTPNYGSLFAVAKASDWRKGDLKVNVLTDLGFLLAGSKNADTVADRLDQIARVTVSDADGSGAKNYLDLLSFDPAENPNVSKFSDNTLDSLTRQGRKGQRVPDRTALYSVAFDFLAAEDVVDQASTTAGASEEIAQVTDDGADRSVAVTTLDQKTVVITRVSKPQGKSIEGSSSVFVQGKQLQIDFKPADKSLVGLGANQALNGDSLRITTVRVPEGQEVTIPKDLIASISADNPTFSFDGRTFQPEIIQDDPVIGWYFPFVAIPEEATPNDVIEISDSTEPGFNLTGTWRASVRIDESDCDEGITNLTQNVPVVQTGDSVNFANGYIVGTLSGNVITFTRTTPEPPGTTTGSGSLTVSADGRQMTGVDNWVYREPGFTCSGTDTYTLSKL